MGGRALAPSCSFHVRTMARDEPAAAQQEEIVSEGQELAEQFKLTYRPDGFDLKQPSEKVLWLSAAPRAHQAPETTHHRTPAGHALGLTSK